MRKSQIEPSKLELPERFSFLARRLGALSYDLLIVLGGLMVMTFPYLGILAWLTEQESPDPGDGLFQLYVLALVYGYVWVSWRRGGQTIGMKAWRLQACRYDGELLSQRQIALRFILAIPSLLLGGIGLWWSAFHPQGLTLHDIGSNSCTRLTARRS